MPYITQEARVEFYSKPVRDLTRGELNYAITRLADETIGDSLNYDLINDLIGALDLTKNPDDPWPDTEDDDIWIQVFYWNVMALVEEWIGSHTVTQYNGVISCVQAELYRRVAAPYEDYKCSQNGDVYCPRYYSHFFWPPTSHKLSV